MVRVSRWVFVVALAGATAIGCTRPRERDETRNTSSPLSPRSNGCSDVLAAADLAKLLKAAPTREGADAGGLNHGKFMWLRWSTARVSFAPSWCRPTMRQRRGRAAAESRSPRRSPQTPSAPIRSHSRPRGSTRSASRDTRSGAQAPATRSSPSASPPRVRPIQASARSAAAPSSSGAGSRCIRGKPASVAWA